MKVTTLLYSVLMLVISAGCKVHREVQKQSSRMDSTATITKATVQGAQLYQQFQNKRLDSSHTNGQNTYHRQTVVYQFTPDTNGKELKGLENRLTGITLTNEQGIQATQTGSYKSQNSDGLNMAKDSSKSEEKKNTAVNKVVDAKQTVTTRKVGNSLWLIILLLIVVILLVIWIWRGNWIVLLIKRIRTAIKSGTPNTPAS